MSERVLLTEHLGYIPDIRSRPTGCTTRVWRRSICRKGRQNRTLTSCDNWRDEKSYCVKTLFACVGEQTRYFKRRASPRDNTLKKSHCSDRSVWNLNALNLFCKQGSYLGRSWYEVQALQLHVRYTMNPLCRFRQPCIRHKSRNELTVCSSRPGVTRRSWKQTLLPPAEKQLLLFGHVTRVHVTSSWFVVQI